MVEADARRKQRFLREAQAAAALHHPHIATVFEVGEADDVTFIAMELVEGEKLSETLTRGRIPFPRALEIGTDIVKGLGAAHDAGIVHRDLKPANILLSREGSAKIIDFGVAKLLETYDDEGEPDFAGETPTTESGTYTGQILGTVSYMSPEQARGDEVDRRSDIFTFGVVLYEMLAGRRPFEETTRELTLRSILESPAPPLSDIQGASSNGRSLDTILQRCLSKNPEERFQSTRELLAALERIYRSLVAPRPRRAPAAAMIAAILVALAVAFVIFGKRDAVPRLGNPRQLTTAFGVEDHPAWSPDGAFHVVMAGSSPPTGHRPRRRNYDCAGLTPRL